MPYPRQPLHEVSAPERFVEAIEASSHFTDLQTSRYPWSQRYCKRDYLDLLLTFSNVLALNEEEQQEFLEGIAEVIDRHGGVVERHSESVLLTVTRR
jgi:hypothetical protein